MNQQNFIILVSVLLFSNTIYAQKLTQEEEKGILLMREEEKLAHDVYKVLYEKWELPIFDNISSSEARHIDAVGTLIDQFELKDPIFNNPGEFQNNKLSELYKTLTVKGNKSLIAALEVGAFIEEIDIEDLQQLLDQTSNETIKIVYGNLLRASGNHLRAFTGQLASRDNNYIPVVLGNEVYQKILNTPHQRGGGKGGMHRYRGGKN